MFIGLWLSSYAFSNSLKGDTRSSTQLHASYQCTKYSAVAINAISGNQFPLFSSIAYDSNKQLSYEVKQIMPKNMISTYGVNDANNIPNINSNTAEEQSQTPYFSCLQTFRNQPQNMVRRLRLSIAHSLTSSTLSLLTLYPFFQSPYLFTPQTPSRHKNKTNLFMDFTNIAIHSRQIPLESKPCFFLPHSTLNTS